MKNEVLARTSKLPDAIVACVGGGSNAIGMFRAFLGDASVALYGVEAAGEGLDTTLDVRIDKVVPPRVNLSAPPEQERDAIFQVGNIGAQRIDPMGHHITGEP